MFAMFANVIFGQSTTETMIWPSVKIDKKINKKTTVRLEHETRYNATASALSRLGNTLEVDYSINKPFNAGVAYTHIYNHNISKNIYANRHRYYLYLRYKHKIGDFSFYVREKFQSTFYNESVESVKYTPQNALRTKVGASYRIKELSLTPYMSWQFKYLVNHPKKNEIDQTRWALGAEYRINKMFTLDLYYQKETEHNAKKPDNYNIIGTTLKVKL